MDRVEYHPTDVVPGRRLRLLATLALPGAVVFGLLTLGLLGATLRSFDRPLTLPVVVSLVLGAWAVLLCGVITYRLGVEAPRVSRAWDEALTERTHVLRATAGARPARRPASS